MLTIGCQTCCGLHVYRGHARSQLVVGHAVASMFIRAMHVDNWLSDMLWPPCL